MSLNWSALGQVAGVSLGVTVAVVVVFSFGVLGLAREGASEVVGRVQAGVCFLACAAVVGYGIYLIVPQFH